MLKPTSSGYSMGTRVLVIGGAGYVGSVLTRRLLDAGYQIRVLDALFYGPASLAGLESEPGFELIVGDTRDARAVSEAMMNVDAVVHLGELVGDPACALDPPTTLEINLEATRRIAEQAREYGVRRLVYPSSCSVYGATDQVVDEESALNPVSLYAETKLLAEEAFAASAAQGLETVILRLATVYGYSPRPRFDLIVNLLAARGLVDRELAVHGGGQWRPFVHVGDVARAMITCLEAPASLVAGRTFNIGSDEQNHTIGEVAELVQHRIPEANVLVEPIDDHRNYRVSFARVQQELNFRPEMSLDDGIVEIQDAIRRGAVRDYRETRHSNVLSIAEGFAAAPRRTRRTQRTPVGPGAAERTPVAVPGGEVGAPAG